MKITHTLAVASAGKLLLASQVALAASKGADTAPEQKPMLSLNQAPNQFDHMIPAFNDEDYDLEGMFEDDLGDFRGVGVIFGSAANKRIDFIVSDIDFPEGKAVDIYLVYGTELAPFEGEDYFPGLEGKPDMMSGSNPNMPPVDGSGMPIDPSDPSAIFGSGGDGMSPGIPNPSDPGVRKVDHKPGQRPGGQLKPGTGAPPPAMGAGEICVGLENVQIIAAVRVMPAKPIFGLETPLGKPARVQSSVVIPINLSDLAGFEPGTEVFFQAAAFPVDSDAPVDGTAPLDFSQGQVSECDRYLMDLPIEGEEGSGSKIDPEAGETEETIEVVGDDTTGGKF